MATNKIILVSEVSRCKNCRNTAHTDKQVYRFVNTGKPYLIRHCKDCGTSQVVIFPPNTVPTLW